MFGTDKQSKYKTANFHNAHIVTTYIHVALLNSIMEKTLPAKSGCRRQTVVAINPKQLSLLPWSSWVCCRNIKALLCRDSRKQLLRMSYASLSVGVTAPALLNEQYALKVKKIIAVFRLG